MKKTILFSILLCFAILPTKGQDTLAGWVFSGTNPDAEVDIHSPLNSGIMLQTEEPQRTINFTKTGAGGGDDKCAETKGWNNGSGIKYWQIEFIPTGYKNLKLSSVQRSCDMHFGPKNFIVQYRMDCCDTLWHNIEDSEITDTSNWQMGVIKDLEIPEECDDEELPVKIRWIMTSNMDINNNPITMMGMSRIDDIFITGEKTTGVSNSFSTKKIKVYPNPAKEILYLQNCKSSKIEILDLSGKAICDFGIVTSESIDISSLRSGIYILKSTQNQKGYTQRFIKL